MSLQIAVLVFILQIVFLYVLTRLSLNELYFFLKRVIKKEKAVFSILSVLFFPGTVLHEFAHFFTAMLLMLKVHQIKIIPDFYQNQIKLGTVFYEKKGGVRGILVGIAPFFAGLFFFWWIAAFGFFPSENLSLNLFFGYLIFTISSTMFSSKKDLIDLVYLIPLTILITGILYVFDIKLDWLLDNSDTAIAFRQIFKTINLYLLFSLLINLLIIIVFKSIRGLFQR